MLLIYTSIPFDTLRVPDIHQPSSRENWKGWRSHECAVEFRELLNEPSSRKPLITKGLGEERAPAGKETPIFSSEGPKPQIFCEKLSETAEVLCTSIIFSRSTASFVLFERDIGKSWRPGELEGISENKVSFYRDESDHGWAVCRAAESPLTKALSSRKAKRRQETER